MTSPHINNPYIIENTVSHERIFKTMPNDEVWRGYMNSMRKDGKFYWPLCYIQPKLDVNGEIKGFIASRKIAFRETIKMDHEIFMRSEDYQDYLDAQS